MTHSGCDASNERHPTSTPSEQKWQIVEDVDNGARKANRRNSVLGAHKQHLGTRSKSSDYQDTRLHYPEEAHSSDDNSSEDSRSEVTNLSYQTLLPSLKLPFNFKKTGTKEKGKNASTPIPARKCSSPQKKECRSKLYDENVLDILHSRYTVGIHGREGCIADLSLQDAQHTQGKPSQLLQWM